METKFEKTIAITSLIVALVAVVIAAIAFALGNWCGNLFSAEGLTALAWVCSGCVMLCALSLVVYGVLHEGSLLSGMVGASSVGVVAYMVAELCKGAAGLNPDFVQRDIFIYPAYYLPFITYLVTGVLKMDTLHRGMTGLEWRNTFYWGVLFLCFGVVIASKGSILPDLAFDIFIIPLILALMGIFATWLLNMYSPKEKQLGECE